MAVSTRRQIFAGDYQIGRQGPLVLQACVGSCVALSLYCPKTRIGGLLHVLLAQPGRSGPMDHPFKYASTGVPLFIDALVEAGADLESLEAVVAGGALVAPLQDIDLAYDVGGRTMETIKQCLSDRNINILSSETGGFFSCCLDLDLATGKATIEPIGDNRRVEGPQPDALDAQAIEHTIAQLVPIPQVILKIMRLIDDDNQGIDLIADELRTDQVLTAQTIKLANSAMFAKSKTIETLDHALLYLGRSHLVNLILSAAVKGFFNQSARGYSLCKGGLYHHALGCAQFAQVLATKTGKADPYKAYTCGLLHDIGKVVLDQYLAASYALFYREVIANDATALMAEQKLVGIDHTEVGRILAEQWQLPPSLKETIRHHHFPQRAVEHKPLVVIVYLADLLLSRFHAGIEIERIDTTTLVRSLAHLDLTAEDINSLVELIPNGIFNLEIEASEAA